MQIVSEAYQKSMKSTLRERGYIMISFGLINQEVQANASIGDGQFAYFSNQNTIFKELSDDVVYATLEQNFTKVDGSMFFLPRESSGKEFFDTGIISKDLISNGTYEIVMDFNTTAIDFKGLTINFGENYPVDFDIIGSTGQTIQFRNNTKSLWYTEEVIQNTTYVKLVVYKMKNEQTRLRIYSIMFGYGLVYYNDSVLDSSLDSYVSPIGADVPQINFSVTLKNYNQYFNVDNPKSAINFLETGQEMDIMYGYQLPDSDKIEWIQGNHLICSEWESDDHSAVIRCQDVFRNMDSEYVNGSYDTAGKSYYSLAEDILSYAGISDYQIDERLKTLYTHNPIPRVQCKQALQIIANACRCILNQTRYGAVQIQSNFMPSATITSNGETDFSNVENVLTDSTKDEYASLAEGYTLVDGSMFMLPKSKGSAIRNTGYISQEISDEQGNFLVNPVLTLSMNAVRSYYVMDISFGNCLPESFIIRTYKKNVLVNEFPVTSNEIEKNMSISRNFLDFDVAKIEFTKTKEPFNRIVVNYLKMNNVTGFTMTRRDMTSSPKAVKQELVKDVVVPYYSYQQNDESKNLVVEDVDVTEGQVSTYYMQDPAYGYSAKLDDQSDLVEIIDKSNYYVTLKFKTTGSYKLVIVGYEYKIVERYISKTLNPRGKTIRWENPLLDDAAMASDLANWLSDYYSTGIEYEYNTRGNPEIDATDIIYQENDFYPNMKVNIYQTTLMFKESFSGRVTARRMEGQSWRGLSLK